MYMYCKTATTTNSATNLFHGYLMSPAILKGCASGVSKSRASEGYLGGIWDFSWAKQDPCKAAWVKVAAPEVLCGASATQL